MIYARIRWSLYLLLKAWPDLGLSFLDGKEGVVVKAALLDKFLQNDFLDKLAMADALSDNRDEALRLGYLTYCLKTYGAFTNDVLLDHAVSVSLASLFGERSVPRPQTIYTDTTRNISSTPFEVLRLLATLPNLTNKFSEYYSAFERAYAWLKETQTAGWTNFKQAPQWRAEPWRSEGVESWLNAQVIDFLASYRGVLSSVTGSALLVEFGANVKRPSVSWADIPELDGAKQRIQTELIEPIKPSTPAKIADDLLPLTKSSLILFGPPGTAKTTIATALAARLEWPLITILPHHIAEEGLHGMVRRAHQVFRRLMVIREAVVFFDEVDELVRSRNQDIQASDKVGRVITTCMLPWFQNLRERAQLVFIVATNHITSFDPAIKRLGRFDYVIPIPPPTADERRRLLGAFLKESLGEFKVPAKDVDEAVDLLCKKISLQKIPVNQERMGGKKRKKRKKRRAWMPTIGELKKLGSVAAGDIKAAKGKLLPEATHMVGCAPDKAAITGEQLEAFDLETREYSSL
jgi:hypothetical protein